MTFYFKVGNFGLHIFIWIFDIDSLKGRMSGFKLWWKKSEPRIEETWYWDDGSSSFSSGRATFRWELRKNGKQFDGFYLQGPLVRFGK